LSVLFLFYFLSSFCSIEKGQTKEKKKGRKKKRNRAENRTEKGQTIEQKQDRQ
jgi:hypothetical protein